MSRPAMLEELARTLALKDPAVLRPQAWEQSLATLPARLEFLDDTFVRRACAYCQLPEHVTGAALAAAQRLEQHELGRPLLWHLHRIAAMERKGFSEWPDLRPVFGPDAGMFYLLALLSLDPEARRAHEQRHIPADIVTETMHDVQRFVDHHVKHHGTVGLAPLYAGSWLLHHFRGQLYRLGRLQFIAQRFGAAHVLLRHRDSGRLMAFAGGGQGFARDGQLDGCAGVRDAAPWTSELSLQGSHLRGHAIDPATGTAQCQAIDLPAREWSRAVEPEEFVLDIHIPSGGPLEHAVAGESLCRALPFWAQHFPEQPVRGFVCTSWLMDPQLERHLEQSNLVRFLREFYLLPTPSDAWAALRFVFDLDIPYGAEAPPDLSTLPRQSALQHALLTHLEAGGRWRKVKGVILAEDLHWGEQVYRSHSGGGAVRLQTGTTSV